MRSRRQASPRCLQKSAIEETRRLPPRLRCYLQQLVAATTVPLHRRPPPWMQPERGACRAPVAVAGAAAAVSGPGGLSPALRCDGSTPAPAQSTQGEVMVSDASGDRRHSQSITPWLAIRAVRKKPPACYGTAGGERGNSSTKERERASSCLPFNLQVLDGFLQALVNKNDLVILRRKQGGGLLGVQCCSISSVDEAASVQQAADLSL